jgi:hypothetical protein
MISTTNSSNTTETSKHTILPLPHLKLLLDRKLPVDADEPLYALYFRRSLTKQKEKRKNSRHRRRSGLMHLQMSLRTFTTL